MVRDHGAGGAWSGRSSARRRGQPDQPAFSDLVQKVKNDEVDSVVINASTGDIQGNYKNKDEFHSTIPPGYNDFYNLLIDKQVQLQGRQGQQQQLDVDPGANLPDRAGGRVLDFMIAADAERRQ